LFLMVVGAAALYGATPASVLHVRVQLRWLIGGHGQLPLLPQKWLGSRAPAPLRWDLLPPHHRPAMLQEHRLGNPLLGCLLERFLFSSGNWVTILGGLIYVWVRYTCD
jgi:hypothetical protein